MVKQYLYCPMIPYFIINLGIKERVTELMLSGRREHEKRLKRMRKQGWEVNVFLNSEKYGIYGYVDAFKKEENGYVVLELKNTEYRKKVVKAHLYQAACYALMVEERFGRVNRVVLKYTDREVSLPLTSGIKKYCISIINKIRKISQGELVTFHPDKKKCLNCGYFKFCREVK